MEKISKIILGFDTSNILQQVKYCRQRSISNFLKSAKCQLVDKCKNTNTKYCFSAFWLGRLAFVPDGRSKPRADSGPNRPSVSAGQPSGGRAAFQIPCIALDLTV